MYKTLKLDTVQLVDEFYESAQLIGIVSSIKDYQLCWHINQSMALDFRVNNELEIKWTKNRRTFYCTVFECIEPIKSTFHYLYNNHCNAEFLLPELKHIDFIWLIKGDYYQSGEKGFLMEQIRQVEGVQLATFIQLSEIKNRQNLIF
jgi:hypothetical protein